MAVNPHENFHDKPQLGPLESAHKGPEKPAGLDFVHIMAHAAGEAPANMLGSKTNFNDQVAKNDVVKDGKIDFGNWRPEHEVKKPEQLMAAMQPPAASPKDLNWDTAPPLPPMNAQSQRDIFAQADKSLDLAWS